MEETEEEVKVPDKGIPIPQGTKTPHGGSRRPRSQNKYDFETRLKLVKLHIEDGHSLKSLYKEFGVAKCTLANWKKSYLKNGEDGLRPGGVWYYAKRKIAAPVRKKIEELKIENPFWGMRKISDVLRRIFLMGASPKTVKRVIRESNLPDPNAVVAARWKRNITAPRFFERSTPNQMWQADICTFRLGDRNAYLIGYIDDYSRFITGLGLYMSQTADAVLEIYRRAVAEYGVPKEMLTDNGRQYASWRGATKFERELKKDHVRHIKSQPHHPMTKGKIERLWKTILVEFLNRAQFETFEAARERVALWVKYYNHQRPHQGIGGLCPADRFFEVQGEVKKAIEQGIAENALELALRGKPTKSLFLFGRIGERSVLLTAGKGKMSMSVDGKETEKPEEILYDNEDRGNEGVEGKEDAQVIQRAGEVPCGAGGVDGEEASCSGVPRALGQVDAAEHVAEPGPGGYVEGVGHGAEHGEGDARGPSGKTFGSEDGAEVIDFEAGEEAGHDKQEERSPVGKHSGMTCVPGGAYGRESGSEADAGNGDEGAFGSDERNGRGRGNGDLKGRLLQVGGTGAGGDAEGAGGPGIRAATGTGGQPSRRSPACGERKAQEGKRTATPRDGLAGKGVPVQAGKS